MTIPVGAAGHVAGAGGAGALIRPARFGQVLGGTATARHRRATTAAAAAAATTIGPVHHDCPAGSPWGDATGVGLTVRRPDGTVQDVLAVPRVMS